MRINLHTHSTESNGRITPKELMDRPYDDGVEICVLTDHDSIEGINEARAIANGYQMRFINGIELSTNVNELDVDFLTDHHMIHMLGLNFDYDMFKEIYDEVKKPIVERLKDLVEILKQEGYKMDYDLFEGVSNKTIIAENFVKHGYVSNRYEALEKIIYNYYDKFIDYMEVSDAVDLVHQAWGKVIWAHPYEILNNLHKSEIDNQSVYEICKALKGYGIDGIETYYGNYSDKQIEYLKKM